MSKKHWRMIALQDARILTLEKLLCPDGHDFVKQENVFYGGSGRGDEQMKSVGYCKKCHKNMEVKR